MKPLFGLLSALTMLPTLFSAILRPGFEPLGSTIVALERNEKVWRWQDDLALGVLNAPAEMQRERRDMRVRWACWIRGLLVLYTLSQSIRISLHASSSDPIYDRLCLETRPTLSFHILDSSVLYVLRIFITALLNALFAVLSLQATRYALPYSYSVDRSASHSFSTCAVCRGHGARGWQVTPCCGALRSGRRVGSGGGRWLLWIKPLLMGGANGWGGKGGARSGRLGA